MILCNAANKQHNERKLIDCFKHHHGEANSKMQSSHLATLFEHDANRLQQNEPFKVMGNMNQNSTIVTMRLTLHNEANKQNNHINRKLNEFTVRISPWS